VGFVEKKPHKLPRPSKYISRVIILRRSFKCNIYTYIYIHTYIYTYIYIAFTNTLCFINFPRSLGNFIREKEGEFNPTIAFYTDYPVCNPNNNFRFEKI
jgi:hypothetical protein